jgi:hypothetical protein
MLTPMQFCNSLCSAPPINDEHARSIKCSTTKKSASTGLRVCEFQGRVALNPSAEYFLNWGAHCLLFCSFLTFSSSIHFSTYIDCCPNYSFSELRVPFKRDIAAVLAQKLGVRCHVACCCLHGDCVILNRGCALVQIMIEI